MKTKLRPVAGKRFRDLQTKLSVTESELDRVCSSRNRFAKLAEERFEEGKSTGKAEGQAEMSNLRVREALILALLEVESSYRVSARNQSATATNAGIPNLSSTVVLYAVADEIHKITETMCGKKLRTVG